MCGVASELLIYVHPALATVTLLLAFLVFRDGFAQRKQRLRRVPAPAATRARHVKLGPVTSTLFCFSWIIGLCSAVLLRKWEPLATFHGKLALITTLLFLIMWWLGRRLVGNEKRLAGTHGVLGLLALFAGGLTGVLGISLLP